MSARVNGAWLLGVVTCLAIAALIRREIDIRRMQRLHRLLSRQAAQTRRFKARYSAVESEADDG